MSNENNKALRENNLIQSESNVFLTLNFFLFFFHSIFSPLSHHYKLILKISDKDKRGIHLSLYKRFAH